MRRPAFAAPTLLAFGINAAKGVLSAVPGGPGAQVRARCFRDDFRSMFATFVLPGRGTFYRVLAFGHRARVPVPRDISQPRLRAEAARTRPAL